MKLKGRLYGVGVGPGDPELISIKACRILQLADVLAAPSSSVEGTDIALDIASYYIKPSTEILHLPFPMTSDRTVLEQQWDKNARSLQERLDLGQNVAFVTIGDPMIYSTYIYMLQRLVKLGYDIETIPGIPSFCASAAVAQIPLGKGGDAITIIPGDPQKVLDAQSGISGTLVFMKPSGHGRKIAHMLAQAGYRNATLISHAGQRGQKIWRDISAADWEDIDYMSIIIARKDEW